MENIYNDPQKSKQMPGVAAIINDRKVTTLELAEECIARHGVEVLGGVISRKVLEQTLKQKKISVTEQDEEAELARAAALMGKLDKQGRPDINGWLKTVAEEQNLPQDIYLISRMPSDPQSGDIVPIALISLALAFVATLYPSWRASRVNPAEALRYE